VFQTTLNDVITYSAIAFDPVYTTFPVNLGAARSRGAELFGEWEPVAGWHANSSYSYTSSVITKNAADPTLVGDPTPDTPKHTFAAAFGYQTAGRPSAFLRGRYLSSRLNAAGDGREIGALFVLDASAAVPVGHSVELFAQAQNILDRLYVASAWGYDARGTPRQVSFGARATILSAREGVR
jgi:outer membrane receptor protein involved in Fe transport